MPYSFHLYEGLVRSVLTKKSKHIFFSGTTLYLSYPTWYCIVHFTHCMRMIALIFTLFTRLHLKKEDDAECYFNANLGNLYFNANALSAQHLFCWVLLPFHQVIDIHWTNTRVTPPNFSVDQELKQNEAPLKMIFDMSLDADPLHDFSRVWSGWNFSKIMEEMRTGSEWPPFRSSNELQNDNTTHHRTLYSMPWHGTTSVSWSHHQVTMWL